MQSSQAKSHDRPIHKASSPQSKLLEIERRFNVPVDQLFQAFTNSEDLKKWWWPDGMHADQVDLEFSEGGRYFINMKGYENGGGGMTGNFEEIVENKRIVMTDQFADENGKAISAQEAKMPGEWPKLVYITFDFAALDANSSRFKLSQQGIPNELQKDCVMGWSQSFNKLKKLLEERRH